MAGEVRQFFENLEASALGVQLDRSTKTASSPGDLPGRRLVYGLSKRALKSENAEIVESRSNDADANSFNLLVGDRRIAISLQDSRTLRELLDDLYMDHLASTVPPFRRPLHHAGTDGCGV